MLRFIVYIGLFLGCLSAQELSLDTPQEAVKSYYYAMNHADIKSLDKVMVKSSFDATMEVWALSKALQDKAFAKTLKRYGDSVEINQEVQDVVRKKLQTTPPKVISELVSTPLGKCRCMIRYKEDGKAKQLYTSLHKKQWKIDYKAGRKVD